jgi:hypothetical protein
MLTPSRLHTAPYHDCHCCTVHVQRGVILRALTIGDTRLNDLQHVRYHDVHRIALLRHAVMVINYPWSLLLDLVHNAQRYFFRLTMHPKAHGPVTHPG